MADVTVATALNELDAQQLCAVLRSEGIPNSIQGVNVSRYAPLQPIEIRVPQEHAERAAASR
jgi:hypothetical protein